MKDNVPKEVYIKKNHLENAFISQTDLYYVRPDLPEKQEVGTCGQDIIFFEESFWSLQQRHYGYTNKPSAWNLLCMRGNDKPKRVTKEYVKNHNIEYFDGYNDEKLIAYINSKAIVYNRKKQTVPKRARSYRATEEEHKLLKEFLKRLREAE